MFPRQFQTKTRDFLSNGAESSVLDKCDLSLKVYLMCTQCMVHLIRSGILLYRPYNTAPGTRDNKFRAIPRTL